LETIIEAELEMFFAKMGRKEKKNWKRKWEIVPEKFIVGP
jgi:hypothetical protein